MGRPNLWFDATGLEGAYFRGGIIDAPAQSTKCGAAQDQLPGATWFRRGL